MRQVAVFGATGSIGTSALDVIAQHPERFRASVLAAHRSVDALVDLCERFRPDLALIGDVACEADLVAKIGGPRSSTSGRKVAAKYRDPETGQTWTGRGLKPKWLAAALDAGKQLADFAV